MLDTGSISAPGASAAALLEQTDPAALDDLDLVAYAQAAERQATHATALSWQASRLVAERASARVARDLASDDEAQSLPAWRREQMAERVGVDEVRQAFALVGADHPAPPAPGPLPSTRRPLAPAGRALAQGRISVSHALTLLDKTGGLPDQVVAELQAHCLPRASIQTPGNFGKSLVRALHHLDPDGIAAAHRAARARTGVRTDPAEDGMGALTVTATEPDTQWAYAVLDTLARAAQHRRQADATDPTNGVARTPSREAECDPPDPDHDGVARTPPESAAARPETDAENTAHDEPVAGDAVLETPPRLPRSDSDGVLGTPPADPDGSAAYAGPAAGAGVPRPAGTGRARPHLPHRPRQTPDRDAGRHHL